MIYIIANPISGGGKGKLYTDMLTGRLEECNREFTVLNSGYENQCIELTREASGKADCELIIAVGGDGTFNEVINGLDFRIPVAFIPAGTGNDFVRGAGIPVKAEEAVEVACRGRENLCDFMEVNGRRCLNVAGTGFDVNVLLCEKKIRKIFPGKISYMLALLKSLLRFRFTDISLAVDGGKAEKKTVMLIAIANGKFYGGGMPISLESECDDGILNLIIINKLPKIKIPYLLIRFLQGKLLALTKYVESVKCKRVEFSVEGGLPVNMDGELIDENPVNINIIEKGIKLIR